MYKLAVVICLFFISAQVIGKDLAVGNLRTEYKTNPMGLDLKAPRFSWELVSAARNVSQTAYHILVSDSRSLLEKNVGNIWDSELVRSSMSIQVPYIGKALLSTKTYYWKVKVTDNSGNNSSWSETATWQMGLLAPADWMGAKWIAYERIPDSLANPLVSDAKKDKTNDNNILPLLRKDFKVKKQVKKSDHLYFRLRAFRNELER